MGEERRRAKRRPHLRENFGGTELVSSINTAIPNWTQVTIPNIQVTNGKATIGMYQVANAGNWINVDDFSFTKN